MSGAVRETTKYFDLEIPQFDFPGWHVYYDRNIKTVDTILYLMTGTDSLKGIWKNNEHYLVGDRVVDTDVAFAYECFVEHTSPPAPTTFAQDRTAHPTYWHGIDFIQALSGTSPTSVTIGLGTKVFLTQTGRVFNAGAKIIINSGANPTVDYMWGAIVSYTGNTLTVNVDVIGGSGTHADWLLSVSGERGPQGIQGEIGLQGPVGPTGPEGPTGPIGPQGIMAEAPTSGSVYGRRGSTATWEVVSATSASVLPITPAGGISSTNVQSALYELDTEKVAIAGGTMTGLLVLSADPAVALGAATKQYADTKLGAAGGTLAGDLTIAADPPSLILNRTNVASTSARIIGRKLNNNRWTINIGDSATESGSNTGSNFSIGRYQDNGLAIGGVPLSISRATGEMTLSTHFIVSAGGFDITGDSILRGDMRAYRPSSPTTGVYYFGDTAFDKYLYYDGGSFRLNGGSLYTDAISTQGSSITAGAINGASISAYSGYIFGHDAFTIAYNGSGYARMITRVDGVRQWSTGCLNDGSYRIYDDSAGRMQMLMETNGNNTFSGTVYAGAFSAPWFYGSLNGSITGNANYANSAGSAGYASSAGGLSPGVGITVGNIEGPYYIDFMHPGHGGDYNARLIVEADHSLSFHASFYTFNSGGIVATGYKSSSAPNNWHFNWSGTLEGIIDGTSWGSVLNVHSDYRMKKDVTDLSSMWDTVKALRPIKYTANDWAPYSVSDETERWGFIAHELQEVLLPTASTGTKDGEGAPQQPHWPPVVAALTKALQEAMSRIETLEATVATHSRRSK